jgi:hypothetical protein
MNNLRGAFRILQVVTTAKTDTFTTASTSFTDVTGFSVSITPSDTNSKILVAAFVNLGSLSGTNATYFRLLRGSTAIAIGDAAGSRTRVSTAVEGAGAAMIPATVIFLDSPATTSSTTYKGQICTNGAGTASFNRSDDDTDAAGRARGISTITVFEISA